MSIKRGLLCERRLYKRLSPYNNRVFRQLSSNSKSLRIQQSHHVNISVKCNDNLKIKKTNLGLETFAQTGLKIPEWILLEFIRDQINTSNNSFIPILVKFTIYLYNCYLYSLSVCLSVCEDVVLASRPRFYRYQVDFFS